MIKNLLIITLRKIIYENRIKTVRFVALVFKRNGNKKIAIKILRKKPPMAAAVRISSLIK